MALLIQLIQYFQSILKRQWHQFRPVYLWHPWVPVVRLIQLIRLHLWLLWVLVVLCCQLILKRQWLHLIHLRL